MDETIKGVFPMDVAATFLCHYYDMYITDRRVVTNFTGRGIFPRSTNVVIIPIGGWIDWFVIRPLLKREKRESSSDLGNILKADEHNLTWDYQNDIKSIEFKKHVQGRRTPPGMVVTFVQGNKKTCFFRHKDFDDIKSLFNEVVSGKITQR